jgi:hypothetical protein
VNNRSLVTASLVGGVLSTILSNTPGLSLINCILCMGFWIGPVLAVWLYRRQTGAVTMQQGIRIGAAAGAWAGLFGFLLSFTNVAGMEQAMETYSQFAPDAAAQLEDLGPIQVLLSLFAIVFNILFGLLGGLIGGSLMATPPPPPPEQPVDLDSPAA